MADREVTFKLAAIAAEGNARAFADFEKDVKKSFENAAKSQIETAKASTEIMQKLLEDLGKKREETNKKSTDDFKKNEEPIA